MTRHFLAIIAFIGAALPLAGQFTASTDSLATYETLYLLFNVRKSPFDDVFVRYAFTLATDRERLAALADSETPRPIPALGLLPPYKGYTPVDHLPVSLGGKEVDLLRYDPTAARLALASSEWRARNPTANLTIEILAYSDEETQRLTAALAEMWRTNLSANVTVTLRSWHDALMAGEAFDFNGVSLEGRSVLMAQPDTLLAAPLFRLETIGWTDRKIQTTLDRIGQERNHVRAAMELNNAERQLLIQMPVIPLFSRAR